MKKSKEKENKLDSNNQKEKYLVSSVNNEGESFKKFVYIKSTVSFDRVEDGIKKHYVREEGMIVEEK